jgi:SWI/SNF-related matrix-associated actin-dependent regulator 1 of chromatin subfamily A
MRVRIVENRFEVVASFADRVIPKSAGFRFDWEKKVWYTEDWRVAKVLKRIADDDALRIIDSNQAVEDALIDASKASTPSSSQLIHPDGVNLYDFQAAGVEYALRVQDVLIADQPGLGKTCQAITICNTLRAKKVLIICPATLKENWKRECDRWLVNNSANVVSGASDFDDANRVIILNYDMLAKYKNLIDAIVFDVLIVDESHFIKSKTALRTKMIVGGKAKNGSRINPIVARKKVFLTGTPILNRPADLWTTLKYFGVFNNWLEFIKRYCGGVQGIWGWEYDGATNLNELGERLRASCMVRRLKEDVLKDLPAKNRRTVYLDVSKKVSALLKSAEERANKCGFNISDVGSYGAMFETLAKERCELGISKLDQAVDYIKTCLEGGEDRLVVFGHHRALLKGLEESLTACNISCVRVDGSVSQKDRNLAIDRFQDGDVRVFIGGHRACGVGITLTKASHIIVIEPDWTPANLLQSEDRCHRIGQKVGVLVDYLVFRDSLDSVVLEKVLQKADIEGKVLDGVDDATVEPLVLQESVAVRDARLESQKVLEVAKSGWDALFSGNRLKAVVQVGDNLHELVKTKRGVFLDGEFVPAMPAFDKLWHVGRCAVCGRSLTDFDSIARGIGPVCLRSV